MWEWYISDPAFASTNNLSGLSSGDLVYIKVTKDVIRRHPGRLDNPHLHQRRHGHRGLLEPGSHTLATVG